MTERLRRAKPESIPAPTAATRPLLGFEIRKIKKDGSRLEELKKAEAEAVLRHSELSSESMAGWQFLHSYAEKILDPAFREELFGRAGKPRVAPLLQKDGRDRVRYKNGRAVAYASIAGFDTEALRNELDIRNEFGPYIQGARMVDDRAGISINNLLLRDLLKDLPDIDADGNLGDALAAMWGEFVSLNAGTLRGGSPTVREVRAKDYDYDRQHVATLSLIKNARRVGEQLADAYTRARQSNLVWHGKPAERYLMMAMHLNAMSEQHFVMWYLGFSHGHPHMRNVVSTMNDKGAIEDGDPPITTSLIDFDQLTLVPEKLQASDELFRHVDTEAIQAALHDERLAVPLKYQMLAYLPANAWDEGVRKFVRTHSSPLRTTVCRALAYRAEKDAGSREQYMRLLGLVYEVDRGARTPRASAVIMLHGNPDLLDASHPLFGPAARYLARGELPSVPNALPLPAAHLVLDCIEKKHFEHYQRDLTLTPEELAFLVLEVRREQGSNEYVARGVLHELRQHGINDALWHLLDHVDLDGPHAEELLEGLIFSAGLQRNDFGSSKNRYKALRKEIQKRTAGVARKRLMAVLEKHAAERLGSGFVLRRKIGL